MGEKVGEKVEQLQSEVEPPGRGGRGVQKEGRGANIYLTFSKTPLTSLDMNKPPTSILLSHFLKL